jgi:hypothetical protein
VEPGRVRIKIHHDFGTDILVLDDRSDILTSHHLTADDFIF